MIEFKNNFYDIFIPKYVLYTLNCRFFLLNNIDS